MISPADLFVQIFDQAPRDLFLGDDAEQLADDDAFRRDVDALEQTVLGDGSADAQLADLPRDASRNRAVLTRLMALDRVLLRVHPKAGAVPPRSLNRLAGWYASSGRLNQTTEGLLLPRLMNYGAPPHLPDKYESYSVIRVEPERMQYLEYKSFLGRGWPTSTLHDDLVVACLPFLDTDDDVSLQRVEKKSGARYRLGPSDTEELKQRVDVAIEALDHSGASIGLLPEGSLSRALLEVWEKRLKEMPAPKDSRLALIIAGSGPVTSEKLPRNRAVALDRRGNRLWEQDKLCDYTLIDQYVEEWKLPGLGDGNLYEDIRRGDKLVVAETSLGRLAILICEDLTRCENSDFVPRNIGVSHILAPVFDAPLHANAWERYAAEKHIRWSGSRVVVSNSRVVGNLQNEGPGIKTALGVCPADEQSWSYDVNDDFITTSPTEAVCVPLRALGAPMGGPL